VTTEHGPPPLYFSSMPHDTNLILTLGAAFGLALLFGLVANRLRLPPLVGYLVAGIAAGPFTPGFVADIELASQLAEVGVILLMFGVGLHFSVRDLVAVRRIALPGAIAQIVGATLLGALLARMWGWPWGVGLVFGLSLSVASTVVLLRALDEAHAVDSPEGRLAIGWLVVEDVVMVVALVLLPAMAPMLAEGSAGAGVARAVGGESVWAVLGVTLAKVAAFVFLMALAGRRAIPWLLERVARTGSRELFTLSVLAVSLGIAIGAAALFGVSFALGAFVAGVVISESELSHQAAADAVPFQDAFAVIFFVSVGMLFDPSIVIREPLRVLSVVAVVMLGKSIIASAIVLMFRRPVHTALTVSASLAQIGEFSFIIAALAISLGVLPAEAQTLILAAAIISITLNPFAFSLVEPACRWVSRRPRLHERLEGRVTTGPASPIHHRAGGHAIIVGYGRVGSTIGSTLGSCGLGFVVIERDRVLTQSLRAQGIDVIFGDAARPGLLEHAGIHSATLLVVTSPEPFQSRQVVALARKVNPGIDTVVRTHSEEEQEYMEAIGVGRAVMGEHELAQAMARYAVQACSRVGTSSGTTVS
jgi:monovalent cation:H+ antiporter-2, CPA2 family